MTQNSSAVRTGRRRTRTAAATAAALVAVTLPGCGSLGAGGAGVTLHLVATDYADRPGDGTRRYWEGLATRFRAEHPEIRLRIDLYDGSEVDRKVASLVRQGRAPDVVQAGSFGDYAAQGRLYPVEELLPIRRQASFPSALADVGTIDGKQYGMPFAASTRALIYNKDLFERAGIPAPPRTWAELAADAARLKQAGVPIPYGLPLGAEESQTETLSWLLSGGGGYTNDAGGYAFDSPENVRTLDWIGRRLVRQGLTGPDPVGTNRQEAYDSFTRGETGMLNGDPALLRRAGSSGIRFAVAPVPGLTGPSSAVTGVTDWMMAFKQNGHRKQIGAFLDFVYQDANVLAFADRYDTLPVTTTAAEAMSADGARRPLQVYLDQLPGARFCPVGKRSWGPVLVRLKSLIGWAVAKNSNPDGVLKDLQDTAQALESTGS
ncbi:ABC transporter substrate-binding protein [Streptomyces sp. MMS24-I31]|uniref:ABC transporter substrate-binding protein n=1 Tax=Streptomyces sp. MMS24-I31 TaxID=3351563 RepID=UPI003896DD0F